MIDRTRRDLTASPPAPRPARGMTLVELLVVVTIMMVLAAFVLPKLELNGDGRKIREAARMTSVFLSSARSRAIETGRPVGVLFEPMENNAGASTVLRQVEVPPLYAGDTENATMVITASVISPDGHVFLTATVDPTAFNVTLVTAGDDRIQLNGQGLWYTIMIVQDSDPSYTLTLRSVTPASLCPTWSAPVSFQIQRHPAATIAPPVILPTGTAVDLAASGTESELFETAAAVAVVFSPTGAVERLYWTKSGTIARADVPSEPIYLLVGLLSHVPSPTNEAGRVVLDVDPDGEDESKPNWLLLTSRWAGINPKSGVVTVAENATAPAWTNVKRTDPAEAKVQDGVDEARQYVKQSRTMGGARQ